ncbi:MAG TPA: NAD(P)-dependent alcohol dehydrogenase [Rhabdochlamydiaceae bacterium]|nr:NAD(P)-dependent alcohol dehydrogenase [Rhabdochlamydiaceae bacterium]
MIHAYAALGAAKPLEPFDYSPPPMKEEEVEIAIECCGLCHSDLHVIEDDWKVSKYPLVPGHEIIGKITRKGKNVQALTLGERVGVGWQCGACLACEFCIKGDETVCTSKVRTCVDRYGGFADQIVVDYRFVYPIPESLSSETAAPLLCAGITVYSPFKLFDIQAPQSVAILGIGGLGHLALQFAKAFGCDVTAISSSPDKEQEARKFGASHFIALSDPEQIKKAVNSFDFILSTISADIDWAMIGMMLRPNAKLCFVGLPPSDVKFPARLLISGNRSICGSGTGSRTNMTEMLQFCARHSIQAQVEVMPMTQLNEALTRLKANKARYRIVLKNSP